jgi:3-deoxy-D-manno-octulosonic-acid transferase
MVILSLIIYNALLFLGLILLWPVWLGLLVMVPKMRAGFWEKLGFYSPQQQAQLQRKAAGRKRVWFHAVSVGEFNAIRSLTAELREEFDVVISCTTKTGHDLAEKTFPDLPILYFPFDFRAVLDRALTLVQPDLVVLTETELWPNFIDKVTQNAKVPLILINGRLSPKSFRGYMRIKRIMKPCLQQITHCYMQAQGDAERIRQLGDLPPEQITVAGNLKFDLNPTVDPEKRAMLSHLLNIKEGDSILTLASTHSGEDQPLLDAYLQLKKDFPELKLILAPRHPERANEIKGVLAGMALGFSLRSQLSPEQPNRHPILILDSIGELLSVYSFSTVAVMGGSFIERGGQNPLEPLSQRVPVVFGPHMHNFAAISQLVLENKAGFQVSTAAELIHPLTELLTQPEIYDSVAEHGLQLLESNRGAKNLIGQAIRQHLAAS